MGDVIGRQRSTVRGCMGLLGIVMLGLIVSLGCIAPASALSPGDKLSGQFKLGEKQIPLPAGEWTLAGVGTQNFQMPALGAFGAIKTAILFLTRADRVVAVLEVNSNLLQVNDGWGRTKGCADGAKQLLLITRYKTGWETDCIFVQPTAFGEGSAGPQAWEDARAYAASNKLVMPRLWLTAGFRISDRQDLVDARYHFDPSLMLGSTAAAFNRPQDWSADAIKADPRRLGAVQVVSDWASGFDTWVERGLRNQIDSPPGPMPEVAAYITSLPMVDTKLAALDQLYRNGRISWASYDEQSRKATTEIPVYKVQTSLLSNSVEKNISFRSLGTFVDYAIAMVVTANNAISWGIALTINSTDSVWFVMNDQYWDDYYAKLNTHDSERIVDFTYVGQGASS